MADVEKVQYPAAEVEAPPQAAAADAHPPRLEEEEQSQAPAPPPLPKDELEVYVFAYVYCVGDMIP